MTDSSEIGRYGTLRLLKRHSPETTVAFFPIDDETVTFGRGKQCSIRLYYDCVSELHCTLQMSEEHKAFLQVHGTNGLLIDGCQVNPTRSPDSGPTTVPLLNGSEIEIYKKRFKFEYPPKEIRAALLVTPRNAKRRRSLRMSMIRSAQVFTPRRNPDVAFPNGQRDNERSPNWEALRSPIKVPSQDGGPDQEMTLLEGEGDDALVVEEEKDIIVLEKVENHLQEEVGSAFQSKAYQDHPRTIHIPPATPPPRAIPIPQSARTVHFAPPPLPINRRRSAPSLHRAVVLRSAQLAYQREQERHENQREEDEVEAEVSPERDLGPLETAVDVDEDTFEAIKQEAEIHDEVHKEITSESSISSPSRPPRGMTAFRASLDIMRNIIPLPFAWKPPEDVPLPVDADDDSDDDDDNSDDDEPARRNSIENDVEHKDVPESISQTPIHRNIGPFMTPQTHLDKPLQKSVKARASMNEESLPTTTFGRAQRVRVVPAWKVSDIEVPAQKATSLENQSSKKERVSEEERRAIMARRKSALSTPCDLPMPAPCAPVRAQPEAPGQNEADDDDTDALVEKMKEKMANMRRQSEARKTRPSMNSVQQAEGFSLLASSAKLDRKQPGQLFPKSPGPHTHDLDNLGFLENNENDRRSVPGVPTKRAHPPLTPRFDGVREMFRERRTEPKTPSFMNLKKLFEHPEVPNTPSFHGVKELFDRPRDITGSTTHLNKKLFDEGDLQEMPSDPKSSTTVKDEESTDDEPTPKAGIKVGKNTAHVAVSPSKRPSRKKEAPKVPSTMHSNAQDGILDNEKVEAALPPRRIANRSAKTTAKSKPVDIPASGQSNSRKASRNTEETTAVADVESTTKNAAHRPGRNRRTVHDDGTELSETKKSGGRIRHSDDAGEEPEVHTNQSENEGAALPRTRRTRAAKSLQSRGVTTEMASAPATTKSTRRTKTKLVEPNDESGPSLAQGQEPSSETESDTGPASTRRTNRNKKGVNKMTPVSEDATSEDKENSEHLRSKLTEKTTGVRTRRPAVSPVENSDVPARRTRSKK